MSGCMSGFEGLPQAELSEGLKQFKKSNKKDGRSPSFIIFDSIPKPFDPLEAGTRVILAMAILQAT